MRPLYGMAGPVLAVVMMLAPAMVQAEAERAADPSAPAAQQTSTPPAAERATVVSLTNPAQSLGVHIGDVLERRLELDVAAPYELSKTALPMKGARQNDIELADIQVTTTKQGDKTRYSLVLRYQVFANATTPVVMALPAETLALSGGPEALSITLPAWRFWFSPLVAVSLSQVKASLQPQYRPSLIDTRAHQWRLGLFLGLFVLGLGGLLYIHADKRWLPFMNGAFAQAHRQLKRLAKRAAGSTASTAEAATAVSQQAEKVALLTLHQAFNRVYGANLFAGDIDRFLAAHPRFSAARAEIEAFFARSSRALFGRASHDSHAFLQELVVLSRHLRDRERGV